MDSLSRNLVGTEQSRAIVRLELTQSLEANIIKNFSLQIMGVTN